VGFSPFASIFLSTGIITRTSRRNQRRTADVEKVFDDDSWTRPFRTTAATIAMMSAATHAMINALMVSSLILWWAYHRRHLARRRWFQLSGKYFCPFAEGE
jgi:hypothetical protein